MLCSSSVRIVRSLLSLPKSRHVLLHRKVLSPEQIPS